MSINSSYWILFLPMLFSNAVVGQDPAAERNEKLISEIADIAAAYRYAPIKPKGTLGKDDGEINFNVFNFGTAIETTRKNLLDREVPHEDYWKLIRKAVDAEIAKSDSIPPVITAIGEFFDQQIESLKARTAKKPDEDDYLTDNDAAVLLAAGLFKVKELNYAWKESLGGKPTTAKGSTKSASAAQGVPSWYSRMTEHKRRCLEYRAKKRAYYRTIHGF